MPGICHNFIITVYLLVVSLTNPEFWYISLSLMMAHKAETRLAIDVLVSVSIIRHWFVLLRLSLFRRTVNLCQQFLCQWIWYWQTLGFPLFLYFWVMENIWMVCIFIKLPWLLSYGEYMYDMYIHQIFIYHSQSLLNSSLHCSKMLRDISWIIS